MRDDLLERRLRAALHHEADQLPMTITAQDLARRRAERRRGAGRPRLTLLLAAAVGVGLLGLGSLVGGRNVRVLPDSTMGPEPAAPIGLTTSLPGWTISAGSGPNYFPRAVTERFTGPVVEAGGPVQVVVTCAGSGVVNVAVDLGARVGERVESFVVQCLPGGGPQTGSVHDADAGYIDAEYTVPAGAWLTISFLIPDPAP